MIPQMENVMPAGTKRFGIASESSLVDFPFNGRITAKAFTSMVAITAILFPMTSKRFFLFGSILFLLDGVIKNCNGINYDF